ncbi:hypothetical protein P879_08395 [Paragonimus westermani]|uniref:Uncharacterized protein n=1 Tax=Paragonimus westermani TaxID=34504 RepID=A0A8T0D0Y1_9TREM|nr:hypothetical protein P879_08395 [Paragonimus westermani]
MYKFFLISTWGPVEARGLLAPRTAVRTPTSEEPCPLRMMPSNTTEDPECFDLGLKISRATLNHAYGILSRTHLSTHRPKFSVAYTLVDPHTPLPTTDAVETPYTTEVVRSWHPHFEHRSTFPVNVNRLIKFRLVARHHSTDTGTVVGYCRLVLRRAAETHGFRLVNRPFELDFHPFPTDSAALQ